MITVTIRHEGQDHTVNVTKFVQNGDGNTKTRKNVGIITGGLSMSPKTSGGTGVDFCPHSSPACVAGCLDSTGLASIFDRIKIARKAKSMAWIMHREESKSMIIKDIRSLKRKADKQGKKLAIRLNMFSDIVWEKEFPELFTMFPDVQFYDYTKNPHRFRKNHSLPENYHLTFSRSEKNHKTALNILKRGFNVAVVFHNDGPFTGNRAGNQVLPSEWKGFPVYNGDESDMRFDDPKGCVVGLKLKAPNKKQRENVIKSGFSVLT